MSDFISHVLQSDFRLVVEAPIEIPKQVLGRVASVWDAEQAKAQGRLVNGTIYSLVEFGADRLVVRACEYRAMLAQRRDPNLQLGIRPLAVTGVLLCADGLVLGRRSNKVATDAGHWEPSPAGGVSQPDTLAQLFEELDEELSLKPDAIARVQICGLLEDQATQVFDLIYLLSTPLSEHEIIAAQRQASEEYDELKIVPLNELATFIRDPSQPVINALQPMLSLAGLLA
jgi:8-oxo-dGTP pyrophosphatase MutT (NUDIX family)